MALLPEVVFKRYRTIVYHGITNGGLLTDFDAGFLLDYSEKFKRYKRHTFVSDAQEAQFDRIEDYLKEELGSGYKPVEYND